MNCPQCGAWSSVLETRGTRRRRECGNGHRFTTLEFEAPTEPVEDKPAKASARWRAVLRHLGART